MTITARIVGKIKIPKLDFTEMLLEIGKKDVAARIGKNIDRGIDLQEESYPSLDAKTIKRKGDSSPLIDSGLLRRSVNQVAKKRKNEVIVRVKAGRRKVAKFLQIDGVRTKKGKRRFNFFGISTRMEKDGIRRMEKEIKKRIQDAGR